MSADGRDALDESALARLAETAGSRLVLEIVDLVLGETPGRLKAVDAHLEAQDLSGVAAVAHSLLGRWGVVGASRVLTLCRRLEERAEAGDLAGATAARDDLRPAVARALDLVRAARAVYES